MNPAAVLLWAAGVAAVIVGWYRLRGPLARYRQLGETEANLRRYETWRGKPVDSGPGRTGADEMREFMRRQMILWGALITIGIVLIFVGIAIR